MTNKEGPYEPENIRKGKDMTVTKKNRRMWRAGWIEPQQEPVREEPLFTMADMFQRKAVPESLPAEERLYPPKYLKKPFRIDKEIQKATLYITAHGVYQTRINGKAVTEGIFAPDYTSYHKYLQYQEYDVTGILEKGKDNVWSIVLADGWYAGRVSMTGGSAQFGNTLGVLAEICIVCTDGTQEWVITDEGFRSSVGRYCYSDIFIGEKQDWRNEKRGWMTDPSLSGWEQVEKAEYGTEHLLAQRAPQVIRKAFLKQVASWTEGASLIVDFGQVIAGRVCFEASIPEGEAVTLEHSEILDSDGRFLNHITGRNKDQKDIFVSDGERRSYEPDFTFHGFRYVRISGAHACIHMDTIRAVVIYSDVKETGSLKTSDRDINKLIENIRWSQRGNMISIPTDCPQRERLGWTGDIQVFAETAGFFMDMESFLERWLENLRLEQLDNGEIPDYCPVPKDYFTTRPAERGSSSAGWGDAIIMVPLSLYKRYGDKRVLEDNFEAMCRWYSFARRSAAGEKEGEDRFLWNNKFHYGDWMFPSVMSEKGPFMTAKLTMGLVGTAFLAHSGMLLAEVAQILGRDGREYLEYAGRVRNAFRKEYWRDGRLTADYQGCYVLAVAFGLLEGREKRDALMRLQELIAEHGGCLDTGFVSIPYLLDVLYDNGYEELAQDILYQKKCPSWLYMVEQGATTVWESWDAIRPDGTRSKVSFNHYALGCVGDWLVRRVGGLRGRLPGFEEFYISPGNIRNISHVRLDYETKFGHIAIERCDAKHTLYVRVPDGTKGYLDRSCIKESEADRGEAEREEAIVDGKTYMVLTPGEYVWNME